MPYRRLEQVLESMFNLCTVKVLRIHRNANSLLLDATLYFEFSLFSFRAAVSSNPCPDYITLVFGMRDLLVSFVSPSLACGIDQRSVVNSLAFFPTLMLRIERGAAAKAQQKQVVRCVSPLAFERSDRITHCRYRRMHFGAGFPAPKWLESANLILD